MLWITSRHTLHVNVSGFWRYVIHCMLAQKYWRNKISSELHNCSLLKKVYLFISFSLPYDFIIHSSYGSNTPQSLCQSSAQSQAGSFSVQLCWFRDTCPLIAGFDIGCARVLWVEQDCTKTFVWFWIWSGSPIVGGLGDFPVGWWEIPSTRWACGWHGVVHATASRSNSQGYLIP